MNQLIPARGDNAGLQLFILIDDTCDQSVGTNFNDIRDFVNAQPATTVIGIGYMSNESVQIVQNFTADHALAAKAIRLPRDNLSSMDSPYLSLISLVKGWPEQKVRREVLMVTDGIDQLRGEKPSSSQLASAYATDTAVCLPASFVHVVEKWPELAGARRMTQFAQRLGFDLANTLASDGEL